MPYTDITKRTYDVCLEDFITQLSDPNSLIYYAKWNTFEDSDIGEAIIKLLASFSHSVDFYRDYYLNNLYLPSSEISAQDQIYEMLNFKPGLRRSMVLTLNFVWKGCGPVGTVIIPKFYKINVIADGIEHSFLTMNSYTYLPYAARLYVTVVLGELTETTLSVSNISGTKYLINKNDIDAESVSFLVDEKEWTQVKNIYYELNPGCKFSVHKESDGTYIYLPSDWKDNVPSEISEISIRAALIQDPFDIQTEEAIQICLVDTLVCSLDTDVTDQFEVHLMSTTTSANSGETGKRRVISISDYEIESQSFSGVVDSKAYNWGDGYDLAIYTPNYVKLVVVGENGDISDFVKKGLKEYLDSIALKEITLEILDPVFRKININMLVNIGTYKGTIHQNEIYQAVRTTILSYMTIGNIKIGKVLDIGELLAKVVRCDSRIKFVDIPNVDRYIPLLNEIPTLGNLYITFNVESASIYDTILLIEHLVSAGPLGVDYSAGTFVDTLLTCNAFITVKEDLFWDTSFPESDLDRQFYDSATLIDTAGVTSGVDKTDSFTLIDSANVYAMLREFMVPDSYTLNESLLKENFNPISTWGSGITGNGQAEGPYYITSPEDMDLSIPYWMSYNVLLPDDFTIYIDIHVNGTHRDNLSVGSHSAYSIIGHIHEIIPYSAFTVGSNTVVFNMRIGPLSGMINHETCTIYNTNSKEIIRY
jgi:hypothetical protein